MPWTLVTEPDERERCCVVEDGVRCPQPPTRRIVDAERSLDGYTYVCGDHAELVLRAEPGGVAEPLTEP